MSTSKYRVYVDKVDSNPEATLQQGFEFIDWGQHISKNSTVFVKPNFCFPDYMEGVTTSPELLRHLLELLKSKADRVIVGESDGGNYSWEAEEAFERHKMYQVCQETGVELISLSKLPSRFVEDTIGGKKVKVELPQLLLEEVDCFISVPVLKVHVMTTVTLGLKNLWGCVPDTMRGLHHHNLGHKLALIAKLLKPRIVIIDGTYGLDKHGPVFGEPVKMDLLIISDNPVAADAVGTMIMGFSPQKVKHIAAAEKAGLGSTNLEEIQFNKDWTQYRRQFQVDKSLIDRVAVLPFNSDAIAKLVYDSPLTPLIYKVAAMLRSSEEKEVASHMGKRPLVRF